VKGGHIINPAFQEQENPINSYERRLKMKKKLLFVVTLTFLALLLAVAPVSAGAIVTREETVIELSENFNDYENNTKVCPDIETIHVEGTYTIKTTTVLDGNGGVHFSSHWNWANFTGTGLTSGDTYVVTQTFSHTEHDSVGENGVENFTLIFNFHLVSKGSGDNIQLHGVNHYTVNANGETTVDKATFRVVCK
jgi:hypothetical protein